MTSDCVASRFVLSLPTFIESVKTERVAVVVSQEPISSRQADEALLSVPTACGRSRSDSLKILNQIQSELKKKSNNTFRR